MPSTSGIEFPKPQSTTSISNKEIISKATTGWSMFELTVIDAKGLRATSISPPRRIYATVSIADQVYKTRLAEKSDDPQWNHTFSFMAHNDQDIFLTVYSVHGHGDLGSHALLGQTKENIMNLRANGTEFSRRIREIQNGGSFTLNFRFGLRNRMFGLIIGIDEYMSSEIPDLHGCKKDAYSIMDFLSHRFHVPSYHFMCLTDEKATRSAILNGFQSHLIENSNIQRGDAIIVFYAGHGSRTAAPEGWVADGNKVETICPHDERTLDHNGKEILGIPDRTIDGLLRRVAFAKGDNITVIFDSCHSGGMTRSSMVPRSVDCASLLPEDLDKDIWTWDLSRAATISVPTGFMYKTMASHVLLAACRQEELAWEISSTDQSTRGAFTACLVKQLYQEDLSSVTYSTLLDLLPALQQQHPQCEGVNKRRLLFNSVVSARQVTFRLSMEDEKYMIDAGHIHGVVKGTLFAVHALDNIMSIDSEIGILEADSVAPHSCTLRRRIEDTNFDIAPGARVSVLNWRQGANILKVFIEPPGDDVKSIEHIFSVVNSCDSADLVIRPTRGGHFQFERLDSLMSKYARVLDNIPSEPSLSDILQGVSQFNYHLSRRNSAHPLKQEVEVVMHRLTQSNPEQIMEEPIYVPDGLLDMRLVLDRENTIFIPSKAITAFDSNRIFYGLTIKNNSGRKLFPYIIYFDPADYSIQSWYHPPSGTMAAPLAARHEDGKSSELPVGYGSAGGEALEFSLADGVTADVGFMKLFVSTTYVDMTVLEQESPFHAARGTRRAKPPSMDIWDTWTYVLRTEETKD